MKPLCVVRVGDERYDNERNNHKKRGLLVCLHTGCLNTNDPHCTKCAERLANAVNSVLRPPFVK
jgi:hypothetical protein